MIPVSKPYLPDREKLDRYIDSIYEQNWVTNNGPLVQELTRRLEEYLEVENLLLVANGTIALQVAYRVFGVSNSQSGQLPEAITTPFTFIATASSLRWDGVKPVFADIDAKSWCIKAENIESKITPNTRAIVPVHVFGNACNVEAIEAIAQKHNLHVIYDASHAFSVKYKGTSLLKRGDASTLSFHGTKLFHTGEGGAIVFKYKEDLERAKKLINFGISTPGAIEELGINAKMSELQAAMGLSVLDEMQSNLAKRKNLWQRYKTALAYRFEHQSFNEPLSYNYAYFPVLFKTEKEANSALTSLKKNEIIAKRYFFPSLESVTSLGKYYKQPVSDDIASRILCLPLYAQLEQSVQETIIETIT